MDGPPQCFGWKKVSESAQIRTRSSNLFQMESRFFQNILGDRIRGAKTPSRLPSSPPPRAPTGAPVSASLAFRSWNVSSLDAPPTEFSDPELLYKPLLDRPNSGACFAGGGTVSASLAVGYLQAFQELGLLGKLRYVSGVSGGAWGTAPFCYLPEDYSDDQYLGPKLLPEQITEEHLNAAPAGSMAYAVSHAPIVLRGLAKLSYSPSVKKTFLEPFGLGDARFFSTDEHALESILSRNPNLTRDDFLLLKKNRPYPIMGAVMKPAIRIGPRFNYPVDFTPLYTSVKTSEFSQGEQQQAAGERRIETFGLNARSARKIDGQHVEGEIPGHHLSLAEAMGSTGNAPAGGVYKLPLLNFCFPRYRFWHPLSGEYQHQNFGDGGYADETGMLALLSRKVENIAVFVTKAFMETPPAISWFRLPCNIAHNQIAPLFGQPSVYRHFKHVFPESQWSELVEGIRQAKAGGGPTTFQARYHVQANEFYRIPGDWECNVKWVFNDTAKELKNWSWAQRLPAKIREQLGGAGELYNFPWVRIFGQNLPSLIQLTPKQANLLGDLAYWRVIEQQEQYQQLLDP